MIHLEHTQNKSRHMADTVRVSYGDHRASCTENQAEGPQAEKRGGVSLLPLWDRLSCTCGPEYTAFSDRAQTPATVAESGLFWGFQQ